MNIEILKQGRSGRHLTYILRIDGKLYSGLNEICKLEGANKSKNNIASKLSYYRSKTQDGYLTEDDFYNAIFNQAEITEKGACMDIKDEELREATKKFFSSELVSKEHTKINNHRVEYEPN